MRRLLLIVALFPAPFATAQSVRPQGAPTPAPAAPGTGALAYPQDMTFSFELEFLVNRQISDADLRTLFPGEAGLSAQEWREWGERRRLEPERWERTRELVLERVRAAMSGGWELQEMSPNTFEIRTNNGEDGFHRNTAEEWAALQAGLARLNAAVPGGFYSAHLHTGREALTRPSLRGDRLRVDAARRARTVKAHEAMWLALAGYGPGEAGKVPWSHSVEPMPDGVLWQESRKPWAPAYGHGRVINLSQLYPTMEAKGVTGLMKGPFRAGHLEPERLPQDLAWAFALVNRVSPEAPEMPLASLGLPVELGGTPTSRQIEGFATLVFQGDPMGRADALARLKAAFPEAAPAEDRFEELYRELGLGVVYDLHKRNEGLDERLAEHLREGGLMRRLAEELVDSGWRGNSPLRLFPAELQRELKAALRQARGVAFLPVFIKALLWSPLPYVGRTAFHELGHFSMAKALKVPVAEVSLIRHPRTGLGGGLTEIRWDPAAGPYRYLAVVLGGPLFTAAYTAYDVAWAIGLGWASMIWLPAAASFFAFLLLGAMVSIGLARDYDGVSRDLAMARDHWLEHLRVRPRD